MIIFIFFVLLFVSYNNMEEEMMRIHIDKKKTGNVEFYYPTYQDYKFWTEEKGLKKFFLEKPFSIKKYHSHNFLKSDEIGLFHNNGKDLFIPNNEKLLIENFNEKMPKKMFFFKDPFFYRENIQYFDVQTPISEIIYINDFLKKEKILGVFFSQSFNEKMNYSIDYRNFHLHNEPNLKESKDLILTTFNFQDNHSDYNYKSWGHYLLQTLDIEEKEKIPKWNIRNYKNDFLSHKKLIHNRFYINFIQKISDFEEKNRSFFLKTYMEYEQYFKNHSFQNLQKKINHFYLRNGLFLIFNQKKTHIEIGSIFDKIHYQLFDNKNYNKKNKEMNGLSIQTKIHYPINNIFELYSNGKWIVKNNNIKDSYFQTNVMLHAFLFPKFEILTQLSIDENDNGFYNNFIPIYVLKKNKDCYNNYYNYERKKTMNFSLNFDKEKYYISFYISRLNHFLQHQGKKMDKCFLYGFNIKTTHDIWKFQLNNILLYQKYNSDSLIFSIPNFLSRSTIFYQDSYFHKALFIQTGFSFHYFSKFLSQKKYYPFDSQPFYFEKECISSNQIGEIPFVDYFLNFKIYRTMFYFKIQNIGFYDIHNPHDNKLVIKTGLLWNLFT
ncbi:putative porin [Blattabacterium cuenoti]|uniref:putative porin n=1 Tax=Blattabacterium cuenoti TaxID=1653831 RepID=UPI00163C8A0D|nr:putative porin [Blattabacterium cuenoti]